MRYAYSQLFGTVMTEDKVKYSRQEIKKLKAVGLTREVHIVKKVFEGSILDDVQIRAAGQDIPAKKNKRR